MSNLDIWERVKLPPQEAMKEIKGGRLSGKTDINPQWRIKAMTEVFGPCGTGWGYSIIDRWTEQGTAGQLLCFVMVAVWYRHGAEKSEPVIGIGGDFVIEQQRDGLYNNDEAYKMALTDALGNALKALGVGAMVYEGAAGHPSKYQRESKPQVSGKPPQEAQRRDDLKLLIKDLLDDPAIASAREGIAERARAMVKADSSIPALEACVLFVKEEIEKALASSPLPIF